MKSSFRYNQNKRGRLRPPRGYVRWLRFYAEALRALLCRRPLAGRAVWAEDAAAELLVFGFPAVLAVPAPLFADLAPLFPDRFRLAAAHRTEDELLALIRGVEDKSGGRFDWDRFLERADSQNRRARLLRAAAERLAALAPEPLDTRSPQSALRSLTERNT